MSQSDAVVFGKNHRNQNQVDPAVSTSNLAQSKVEYSKLFDVFLSPSSGTASQSAASMNSLSPMNLLYGGQGNTFLQNNA